MVHALSEAHRVLKPDGILIDLRPKPEHRQVGIGSGRRWAFVGETREGLEDDEAADRAVAEVLRAGLFRQDEHVEFMLERVMDSLADLDTWLDEFSTSREIPPHTQLIARVERALRTQRRQVKIVARGGFDLRVLKKLTRKNRVPAGNLRR